MPIYLNTPIYLNQGSGLSFFLSFFLSFLLGVQKFNTGLLFDHVKLLKSTSGK